MTDYGDYLATSLSELKDERFEGFQWRLHHQLNWQDVAALLESELEEIKSQTWKWATAATTVPKPDTSWLKDVDRAATILGVDRVKSFSRFVHMRLETSSATLGSRNSSMRRTSRSLHCKFVTTNEFSTSYFEIDDRTPSVQEDAGNDGAVDRAASLINLIPLGTPSTVTVEQAFVRQGKRFPQTLVPHGPDMRDVPQHTFRS